MTRRRFHSGQQQVFWNASPVERRQADLFFADLLGLPAPRQRVAFSNQALATHEAFSPGEAWAEDQSEPVPRAAAPHILDFKATGVLASNPTALRTSLRDKAVELLRKLEDLGIRDDPKGRCDAYVDAIAWNEPDNTRSGFRQCPKVDGQCLLSSCALVVRSLWRLLGARDVFRKPNGNLIKLLDPPYMNGSAMTNIWRFAELSGALEVVRKRSDFDRADPQPGDVIFINQGTRQHVFTVIERQGDKFISIDGGQSAPGDGSCCSIQRHERTLPAGALTFEGDDRPIRGVVKLDRLRLTAPLIDLERKTPGSAARAEAWAGEDAPPTTNSQFSQLRNRLVASITSSDLYWHDILLAGGLRIKVSSPILKESYFVPGTSKEALDLARKFEVFPLTRAVMDQVHNSAIQVAKPQSPSNLYDFVTYSNRLRPTAYDTQYGYALASGAHKLWVLSSRGPTINYGFYIPRVKGELVRCGPLLDPRFNVIQSLGARHNDSHWDYSQLLQFMTDLRDESGKPLNLRQELLNRNPAIWDEKDPPHPDGMP